MRTLELNVDGETYHAAVRQGLATIHDSQNKLVRVHRIDGGRPQPSPGDRVMDELTKLIRSTEGGAEYLEACADVRAAREMALADPASKWRDYEAVWLDTREIREGWEDGHGVPIAARKRGARPPSTTKLPRSSVRRRLVAWGQR